MKTRPEVTGRSAGNASSKAIDADDLDAYSIRQFCKKHGFCLATFYKFKDEMPDVFRVGDRVLISKEAAARWRREREKKASAATATA